MLMVLSKAGLGPLESAGQAEDGECCISTVQAQHEGGSAGTLEL